MSGHEEKTLQNTTVVIDKAKNCFSLSNQTKYSRTKMKYSCCFFSLLLEEVFMYFCKRNRDAKRKKKTLLYTKRFSTISCRFCKFCYNTSVY